MMLFLCCASMFIVAASACTVSLTKQKSSHKCSLDTDYGCYANNNSMFVKGGCRGTFTCNDVANVLCDPCDPGSKWAVSNSLFTDFFVGPGCNPFKICPCTPPPPTPAPPPAPKYMLLDDRNIISTTATFVLGKVTKHPGGALLKEERDYEMR